MECACVESVVSLSVTASYFFARKPLYECTEEERKEVSEKVAKLTILHQMLVLLNAAMDGTELIKYDGTYKKKTVKL